MNMVRARSSLNGFRLRTPVHRHTAQHNVNTRHQADSPEAHKQLDISTKVEQIENMNLYPRQL